MKKSSVAILLFPFLFSCNNSPKEESPDKTESTSHMEKFKWLLGNWEKETGKGMMVESWIQKNDSIFAGRSYLASKNDTVYFETIELVFKDGNFFYVPTVNGQNENQPVFFKLVSETNGEFIFENKEHDFPQRVIYKNPLKDSLSARIEGMQEGKFRKEEFGFRRGKN